MKFIFLALLLILLLILKIIKFFFNIQLSDLLSIISILVDFSIPFIIAYYLQNKFFIDRSLKSYHMNMCDSILNDYKIFLEDIVKGCLNRKEIASKFKNFTTRFNSLDKMNAKRFKVIIELQLENRQIHTLITNSREYNNSITNSKVKISPITISQLNIHYAKLLEVNGDLIYTLNK